LWVCGGFVKMKWGPPPRIMNERVGRPNNTDHGKQHAVIDGVSPIALIVTGEGSGNVARGANNET